MDDNKLIDGAEIITLDEIKHLKLPYFEGLAAGYPSQAADYQHESLDLNEKWRNGVRLLCAQIQAVCDSCDN